MVLINLCPVLRYSCQRSDVAGGKASCSGLSKRHKADGQSNGSTVATAAGGSSSSGNPVRKLDQRKLVWGQNRCQHVISDQRKNYNGGKVG